MDLPSYGTFAEAYADGLRALVARGHRLRGVQDEMSVGSGFGQQERPTVELCPYGFRLTEPRSCLIASSVRQPDLGYVLGQWLWTMRGSDDISSIAFYNGRGRLFSDDGRTLAAAPGARLRRPVDQIEQSLALLRRDPATRRARLVLARPQDVIASSRDVSCVTDCQLFVREGKLVAHTSMRSQSALMVLPYDVSLFCLLQCWMAAILAVDIGSHVWIAHSFHLYEDEQPLADRVLANPPRPVWVPPIHDPSSGLRRLLEFETELAMAVTLDRPDVFDELVSSHETAGDLFEAIRGALLAVCADRLERTVTAHAIRRTLPKDWQRMLPCTSVFAHRPGLP